MRFGVSMMLQTINENDMGGIIMNNKTWLITGVSSGFGYEMTKLLLEKGDTVVGLSLIHI